MPEPRQGETQDQFIQRCMSDSEAVSDFPDASQRRAFCQSQWDRLKTNRNQTIQTARSTIGDREGVRHAVHEGRDHLVVPVVMIVEGVMNGALVTQEEFGRFPQAWDGRPVPVLHPERDGLPVSANQPDIIEANTIGKLFNTFAENGKLKSEAWIDTGKAKRLGHNALLEALESGQVIEVSTGYFADSEAVPGEFNAREYNEIHRNIRPDHLALLPGEIGACSVDDGCGTRVNAADQNAAETGSRGIIMRTKEAFGVIAQALGLRDPQCGCQTEDTMTDKQRAERVKALKDHLTTNGVDDATVKSITTNEKLTPEQIEMLMGLDQQQLKMVKSLAATLAETEAPADPDGEGAEGMEGDMPMDPEDMQAQSKKGKSNGKSNGSGKAKQTSQEEFDAMVANKVADHLRRHEVISKLKTNERNPFSEDEMKAMNVDHLEKLEKSIRPADYSGQGGFAANAGSTEDVQPLQLNRGVLSKPAKQQEH